MPMIMNEFDMFRVLLEKAEKKEVEKDKAKEFFELIDQNQIIDVFFSARLLNGFY